MKDFGWNANFEALGLVFWSRISIAHVVAPLMLLLSHFFGDVLLTMDNRDFVEDAWEVRRPAVFHCLLACARARARVCV